LVFFALYTWASYAHWANFEYRTFDLAYYVQALWQLITGIPSVGRGCPAPRNHVRANRLLIAPLFLVARHPLALVVAQNTALASMGPVAFSIGSSSVLIEKVRFCCRRILLTPSTGYIALHEFIPKHFGAFPPPAFTRASGSRSARMGLAARRSRMQGKYGAARLCLLRVHVVLERKRPMVELRTVVPLANGASILWFFVCTRLITPALNAGSIDYFALYDRASAGRRRHLTQGNHATSAHPRSALPIPSPAATCFGRCSFLFWPCRSSGRDGC